MDLYFVLGVLLGWLVGILVITLFFKGATEKSIPTIIQQKLRGK